MKRRSTAVASPLPAQSKNLDPKNVNARIYNQLDVLLTQLETGEHITLKERTAALLVATRIQAVFVSIRKEKLPDEHAAGSTVRKYAEAFAHDARRRAAGAGRAAAASDPGPDDDDDDREGMGFDPDDDEDPAA